MQEGRYSQPDYRGDVYTEGGGYEAAGRTEEPLGWKDYEGEGGGG